MKRQNTLSFFQHYYLLNVLLLAFLLKAHCINTAWIKKLYKQFLVNNISLALLSSSLELERCSQ